MRFSSFELERLALDELRWDARVALNCRSLTSADWNGVREGAGAAGLQLDEMSVLQLRALVTGIEKIPRWSRPAENAAPRTRRKVEKVGKPFGWVER